MRESLKELLRRTLLRAEDIAGENSPLGMSCRAALGRIDTIVNPGGSSFLNDRQRKKTLNLLHAAVEQTREWPREYDFLADEFEDLVSRIEETSVFTGA